MTPQRNNLIDVVGIGVATVDVLSLVDHMPVDEEVQRAADVQVQGGGPVATALVALAKLGATTCMIDAMGDDWRGAILRQEFDLAGVSMAAVRVRPGHSSGIATVLVNEKNGARSIVFCPGSAPELEPDEVPEATVRSAKYLHVNGRHWPACLQAVRWARDARVAVSFDGGTGRFRPELRELVLMTSVCIVSRPFAADYTGHSDVEKAAATFLGEGPALVVITAGTEGSWVYERGGQRFHQPAFLLPKIVDTTGCGDAYHGAFLFGLLEQWPLESAAALASAVAAMKCRKLGGRAGLPTLDEVTGFLRDRGCSLRETPCAVPKPPHERGARAT